MYVFQCPEKSRIRPGNRSPKIRPLVSHKKCRPVPLNYCSMLQVFIIQVLSLYICVRHAIVIRVITILFVFVLPCFFLPFNWSIMWRLPCCNQLLYHYFYWFLIFRIVMIIVVAETQNNKSSIIIFIYLLFHLHYYRLSTAFNHCIIFTNFEQTCPNLFFFLFFFVIWCGKRATVCYFYNNQTYKRYTSRHHSYVPIKGPLGPVHHGNMVPRGLSGPLNWAPIMLVDVILAAILKQSSQSP